MGGSVEPPSVPEVCSHSPAVLKVLEPFLPSVVRLLQITVFNDLEELTATISWRSRVQREGKKIGLRSVSLSDFVLLGRYFLIKIQVAESADLGVHGWLSSFDLGGCDSSFLESPSTLPCFNHFSDQHSIGISWVWSCVHRLERIVVTEETPAQYFAIVVPVGCPLRIKHF